MNEYFLKVKTAQPYQGVPNKMSISCILIKRAVNSKVAGLKTKTMKTELTDT